MATWKDEFCRRAAKDNFPIFKPYFELTKSEKESLWKGLPSDRKKDIHDRICIDTFFQMLKENQYKIQYRVMLSRYRGKTVCPDCHGTKLKKEATMGQDRRYGYLPSLLICQSLILNNGLTSWN